MQISCRGWSRTVKDHRLLPRDTDLSTVTPAGKGELWQLGEDVHIEPQELGVSVTSSAKNITLNGNYWITIELTMEDVAALARIAFANEPFGKVIAALNGNNETGESQAKAQAQS